jgi:hypothetical protein
MHIQSLNTCCIDFKKMTNDIFSNYPLIIYLMNEIPEQLGLKCKHSTNVVRWGKNDVVKIFRRPKVVVCSNPILFRKRLRQGIELFTNQGM